MSVFYLTNQLMGSTRGINSTDNLKMNQIIQGKVLALYPPNKVKIAFGSKQIMAQMKTPLDTNKTYFLQVIATHPLLELKVLHTDPFQQGKNEIQTILQQINLPITPDVIRFVEQLNQDKVIFHLQDLKIAYSLVHQHENKELGKQVVRMMFLLGYPIKSAVFHAFMGAHTLSFSQLATIMLQKLEHQKHVTFLEKRLMKQIQKIMKKPPAWNETVLQEKISTIHTHPNRLFYLFHISGSIGAHMNVTMWMRIWDRYVKKLYNHQNRCKSNRKNQNYPDLPFDKISFLNTVEQLLLRKEQVQSIASYLQVKIAKNPGKELRIIRKYLPSNSNLLTTINRLQQEEILALVKMLDHDNTYERLQMIWNSFQAASVQRQFLHHVKSSIEVIGLDYEYQIRQGHTKQTASIKGILLQLIQKEQTNNDPIYQQLLHIISGLQLQFMHESQHMIQFQFQIPGEKLGLKHPPELTFTGKKEKDGIFNTDFFSLVFRLNLPRLNETNIDMHVQERKVTITIYHDFTKQLKAKAVALETILKKKLSNQGYTLLAVYYKARKNQINCFSRGTQRVNKYGGIDYKI